MQDQQALNIGNKMMSEQLPPTHNSQSMARQQNLDHFIQRSSSTNLQQQIGVAKQLYDQLVEQWDNNQMQIPIPFNHRQKFIQGIQELQFDIMNQVLH